ncbi:C-type lectin domain family 4 member F-like [Halichoeres trimaculatus]|uniref:C-type lectin domain family 4 member F-like n=1 Tax=Halichoeres trimaculatus TaxID=147232 RepID=UPI003D9F28C9
MHELIFDNNPGEQMEDIRAEESDDVVEKTVEIYEGLDPSKDHRAVTQVTAPRHPDKSWAEKRHQTLVELSHFCKDGCMSFRGSFYYISARQKSWVDSRHDCKGRGADLVIVNKKEEQEFINSLSRVFWIGLTDREEEGTWKWVDGSVLNSTGFWKTGQPSGWFGGLKEDCVNTFWPSRTDETLPLSLSPLLVEL